jgi:PIN domain nuclease of toxin-antitoxin system
VKYLLDTGIWLWSIGNVERIAPKGREVLTNGQEEIYLSAASSWEISIKAGLGKLHLPAPPAQCIPSFMARQNLLSLPVTHAHAVKVYDLPPHHRDPFDRLILAQSIVEEMTILTADKAFTKYPVETLWCGT